MVVDKAHPATHDPDMTPGASPLRPGRVVVTLAALAVVPSVLALLVAIAVDRPEVFNDFHSYWYAGRLLAEGSSPYDLQALRDLAARQGDAFVLGTGYSYPLPFAILMVPIAALPFDVAVVLFTIASLIAFGATVAMWLERFHPAAATARLRPAAFLCGAFPPVVGSVINGQVNLIVLAAVAFGATMVLGASRGRAAIGGVALGLAAVVKIVPGVVVVPLWLARRRLVAGAILGGVLVPLGLAAVLEPVAARDSLGLAALLGPDPFVTNQSVNGFVSRLVGGSDRMTALAAGAFDPAPVSTTLTGALALATAWILWRARATVATRDGLAIGLALGLVAATAGAPKTSFWNVSLVLVAMGLLLVVTAPTLELHGLDRVERRLAAAWAAGVVLQPLVWAIPAQPAGPAAAAVVIVGSICLYGNLALWWLLGRRLLRPAGQASRPAAAATGDAPLASPRSLL